MGQVKAFSKRIKRIGLLTEVESKNNAENSVEYKRHSTFLSEE